MATQEQIEQLKANWKSDPCWDIQDTEGFEEHRQELVDFATAVHNEWKRMEDERKAAKCEKLGGISTELLDYIEFLEFKINRLERLVHPETRHA